MSPILVRPVREQLEHDRIIRLLPGRYKRRFDVGINPGAEQNAAIGSGISAVYPDAVLYSTEKARKIQGVVEVETIESINHLEVMAQWAPYSRLKIPFHLYVPVAALDVARRLSADHQVVVSEIWSYDNVGDQVRFTLVHKVPETTVRSIAAPPVVVPKPPAVPKPTTAVKPAAATKPPSATKAPAPAKPTAAAKPLAAAKPPATPKVKPAPVKKVSPAPARPVVAARPATAPRKATTVTRARPAAKPTAKRAPAVGRGRASTPARKAAGATKRK